MVITKKSLQNVSSSGGRTPSSGGRPPGSTYEDRWAMLEDQMKAIQEQMALLQQEQEEEQALLAEQQRLAEEERLAEERRLAEELDGSSVGNAGIAPTQMDLLFEQLTELRNQNAIMSQQIALLFQHSQIANPVPAATVDAGSAKPSAGASKPSATSAKPSVGSAKFQLPRENAFHAIPANAFNGASHRARAAVALTAPTLTSFNATSGTTLRVAWNPVPDASSYTIKTATNTVFTTDVRTFEANASASFLFMGGFLPGTRYYVHIMANGDDVNFTDSAWSTYKYTETWESVGSGGGGGAGDASTQLQNWLVGLQNMNQSALASLPEVENGIQSPSQRRRLLGSGVRRYGYFDKISDTAIEYPQYWPLGRDESEKMKEVIREIEILRNLLIFFESGARMITDRLLVLGDEVFRIANIYYIGVREAARRQLDPDAEAVFRLVRKFWKRIASKRFDKKLTQKQALRDFKALQRGTKVGSISISKEADRVIPGKRSFSDNARPKPKDRYEEIDDFDDDWDEEE